MLDTEDSKSLGLFIQPACLQHRYIRHANSSHIFERPERLRAVLLGVAAAIARLEEVDEALRRASIAQEKGQIDGNGDHGHPEPGMERPPKTDDLSTLLSSLSIESTSSFIAPSYLKLVPPPPPQTPGQILLHHPALQIAHSPPPEVPSPYMGAELRKFNPQTSPYLNNLFKWASEAVERIKETGSEIPMGLGLNQGDLYLGPGSVVAIEGAIQTVCQAIDRVCESMQNESDPSTPPIQDIPNPLTNQQTPPHQTQRGLHIHSTPPGPGPSGSFTKAFCVIRPPGHHCGEDAPSGFCYVNNVVVGAMHGYLEHDIDRTIIIDFDLHHGNGTQALVMPLNAASHAEDLMVKAGKPPSTLMGVNGKRRRGWKGFYGSVHDIYSYPCEDGDLDLVKDASISLAGHGQYIENIHLQPYASEADFYARIYPKYLALLDKARNFMEETAAEASRTIVLISAGFDACEHEHQGMQRHDRRVPVSFFSKYTKDIVHFAETYTEGKIVSVLEGGYSDRALTSAAMGHIIGMVGREGNGDWWTEEELIDIEKATKRKRTGKLAPFPVDLSHKPYLSRTYNLLSHFENTSLPEVNAHSLTPSRTLATASSTPSQRMTLRDRRKITAGDDEAQLASGGSTPPGPKRGGRGRGGTPGGTPARRGAGKSVGTPDRNNAIIRLSEDVNSIQAVPPVASNKVPPATGLVGTDRLPDQLVSNAADEMAKVTLGNSATTIVVRDPVLNVDARIPDSTADSSHYDLSRPPQLPESEISTTNQSAQLSEPSAPKVILRFARPPPADPRIPTLASIPDPLHTFPSDPSSRTPTNMAPSIYPILPHRVIAENPLAAQSQAGIGRQLTENPERYREISATPSTSTDSEEYVTAVSRLSESEQGESETGVPHVQASDDGALTIVYRP